MNDCPRCPSEVAVEMSVVTPSGVIVDHYHPNQELTDAYLLAYETDRGAEIDFVVRAPTGDVDALIARARETVTHDRTIGAE